MQLEADLIINVIVGVLIGLVIYFKSKIWFIKLLDVVFKINDSFKAFVQKILAPFFYVFDKLEEGFDYPGLNPIAFLCLIYIFLKLEPELVTGFTYIAFTFIVSIVSLILIFVTLDYFDKKLKWYKWYKWFGWLRQFFEFLTPWCFVIIGGILWYQIYHNLEWLRKLEYLETISIIFVILFFIMQQRLIEDNKKK